MPQGKRLDFNKMKKRKEKLYIFFNPILKTKLRNTFLRHVCVLDNDIIVFDSNLSAYIRLMFGHDKTCAYSGLVR